MQEKCQCKDRRCRLSRRDSRHGTYGAYTYHKCRCPKCMAVYAAYQKGYRAGRLFAMAS